MRKSVLITLLFCTALVLTAFANPAEARLFGRRGCHCASPVASCDTPLNRHPPRLFRRAFRVAVVAPVRVAARTTRAAVSVTARVATAPLRVCTKDGGCN